MPPLYICHGSTFGKLEHSANLCESNGYGIELSDFFAGVSHDDRHHVDTVLKCLKFVTARTLHGPYLGMNPVSTDLGIREATRRYYETAFETAVRLDAAHIILHSIYDPSQLTREEWFDRSVLFWQDYLAGKSGDIRFHIENVMDKSPGLLADLITSVGNAHLDIALDIGHAHVYSDTPVTEWISTLGDTTGYVHLHDNRGIADDHSGLGEGTILLDEVCTALETHAPQAVWSIESGGIGTTQSLSWLYRHGFIDKPVVAVR